MHGLAADCIVGTSSHTPRRMLDDKLNWRVVLLFLNRYLKIRFGGEKVSDFLLHILGGALKQNSVQPAVRNILKCLYDKSKGLPR